MKAAEKQSIDKRSITPLMTRCASSLAQPSEVHAKCATGACGGGWSLVDQWKRSTTTTNSCSWGVHLTSMLSRKPPHPSVNQRFTYLFLKMSRITRRRSRARVEVPSAVQSIVRAHRRHPRAIRSNQQLRSEYLHADLPVPRSVARPKKRSFHITPDGHEDGLLAVEAASDPRFPLPTPTSLCPNVTHPRRHCHGHIFDSFARIDKAHLPSLWRKAKDFRQTLTCLWLHARTSHFPPPFHTIAACPFSHLYHCRGFFSSSPARPIPCSSPN